MNNGGYYEILNLIFSILNTWFDVSHGANLNV